MKQKQGLCAYRVLGAGSLYPPGFRQIRFSETQLGIVRGSPLCSHTDSYMVESVQRSMGDGAHL